jgi:hypothetical protein
VIWSLRAFRGVFFKLLSSASGWMMLFRWFACVYYGPVADSCAELDWWLMQDGRRVDVRWIEASMLADDVSSTRAPEESKADDIQRRCR